MKFRRFEYTDEKSSKFWEISVDGNEHTVRYGRIGSEGQTKTKAFDDGDASRSDAEKLIKSKTQKGYLAIEDADGPGAGLQALLKGLCKTPEDHAILQKLSEHCIELTANEMLFDEPGDNWEVTYTPGREVQYHASVPKSFSDILGVVSSLGWDAGGIGGGFALGENGEPKADDWLFGELELHDQNAAEEIRAAGEVVASFFGGQNALFFDPTNTLSNGEPGLAFLCHEELKWKSCKSVQGCDYGQILLRLFSDRLADTRFVPEVSF